MGLQEGAKGGGSGGGAFSGDHLPVSGACSCRARFFSSFLFFFFLPMLYAGVCVCVCAAISAAVCKHVAKEASEGDCQMAAAVNDFRRQFFVSLDACCFTFASRCVS